MSDYGSLTGVAAYVIHMTNSSGYALAFGSPLTNLTFSGNYLKRAGDLCNLSVTGVTGRMYNNVYDGVLRVNGSAPGLLQ